MNKYKLEIYQDRKKEFRYRVLHKNGNELFKSSEGYKSKKRMIQIWDDFLYTYINNVVDLTESK